MSNAVVDEGIIDQKLQERINAFKMPRPKDGQAVLWYRHGIRMSGPKGDPETAFIIRAGERNVKLRTSDGMVHQTVLHIEDPRLGLNDYQRQNGAWDFTEEYNFFVNTAHEIQARMTRVEQKLRDLEKVLADLNPSKNKKPASEAL